MADYLRHRSGTGGHARRHGVEGICELYRTRPRRARGELNLPKRIAEQALRAVRRLLQKNTVFRRFFAAARLRPLISHWLTRGRQRPFVPLTRLPG